MESARWERIQALFHDAVALEEASQSAFLERECNQDAEMAGEVLSMLEQHRLGTSILDRDLETVARQVLGSSLDSIPLGQFHPYLNLRELGRGGMGIVFRAEREDGNPVAIKVLRDWWVSPDRRRRFATEQRALGKLEHPYIARLYHAAALAGGTPWFAMEYVEGKHLDVYCRERRCSIESRMRFFRLVCEAVQYAHRLGIIHCDLKPSNILVKDDGTVRLLDFGIAKQLENSEEPGTRTELRFMTLPYAAPEQMLGGQAGTYTDIYALGVVLYELLADQVPFDVSKSTHREAEQMILGQDPLKPSVAAKANGLFPELSRSAWSDLDVLCLTAMNKEVHERYESAGDLIRDVDHYLKGEPLDARPVSFAYRAAKFVKRNQRAVLASTLGLILLAGLVIYFTVGLARARNTALAEGARTQRVEQFMENLFDAGDKEAGPADDLRVVTLVDRGLQEAQSLNGDPTLRAELYQALGGIYQRLGKFDRADALLRSSLEHRKAVFGNDHPVVAESLVALGLLRLDQARLTEAEGLIRQAIAIDQRHLLPGSPDLARTTAALGRVLNERGQYGKAIEAFDAAIAHQPAGGGVSTDLASSMSDLADAHFYLGHYAIADPLYRRVLAMHQKQHGPRHPSVGEDLINLGHIEVNRGNYPEAEKDYRGALEILKSWYGSGHPATARAETYLAQALFWEKRYPETKDLLQDALATLERTRGKTHPQVALVLGTLASLAGELGNMKEAEADFGRMANIYRSVYGEHHQMTAMALNNLATIYMRERDFVRAEPIFRQVIQCFEDALPSGHLNIGIARIKLGRTLARQGRFREAEVESLAGYGIVVKQTRPSIDWLQGARRDLTDIYEGLKQPAAAARYRAEFTANEPRAANPPAVKSAN